MEPDLASRLDRFGAGMRRPDSGNADAASHDTLSIMETVPDYGKKGHASALEFARRFLRLANLPNFALDRLSRYETKLWRQASRILYALETLDRRKPQERTRRFWPSSSVEIEE